MKAVRIHRFGGPEVMAIEDLPVPQPRDDEILLRVRAASVNPVDYKTRSGQYPKVSEDQLPMTLGRDVSGIVERCGANVDSFAPGDEVYALLQTDHGGFADYAIVPAADAALKPPSLSHVEAAAVPLAALTAWQGLFDYGRLEQGEHVLIHGGGGGVGHFAIQFAVARGARVTTTVSTPDITFARDLGADAVIDYKTQRFDELVHDVDLVLDLVAGETQERSWSVLKRGGRLVSALGEPSHEHASRRDPDAQGIGFLVEPNGAELTAISDWITDGKVRPCVQATFPLEQARDAEQRQENEYVQGKLVLEIAA